MNSVNLIGRLTADPELRKTSNDISNCKFTLAVDGRKTEEEQHTDFISIVAWRKTAELICEYLKKGSLVGITGRIQTGSYQAQDGSTRYTTDVVVDNVRFLSYPIQTTEIETTNEDDPFKDFGEPISDDDLPF